MEETTCVFEISSDEEEVEEGQKNTDHDWLKEFIWLNGEEKPEVKSKSSVTKATMTEIDDDDDDDDCLVLECDPENIVTTSLEEAPPDSDELVVVGEKGQVACRDYPHPRHLCVKFPFSSTSHVKHCEKCHCYVCDSLAPCQKWGTGISITDHCHATDKSNMWKTQRTNFKCGKTNPKPASTNYGTLCNVGNPLHNHNMPFDVMQNSLKSILLNSLISSSEARHTHSSLNPRPQNPAFQTITTRTSTAQISSLQNQVLSPVTNPLCSITNLATPHISNQGKYNESVSSLASNRHQSYSAVRQMLGVKNCAIQKERVRGAVSLGLQYPQPYMLMSNQVGSAGSNLLSNISSCSPFSLKNNQVCSTGSSLPSNITSCSPYSLNYNQVGSAGSTLPPNITSCSPFSLNNKHVGSVGSTLRSNISSCSPFSLKNNHVISAQQDNRYYPEAGFSGSNRTIYRQGDVRVPNIVSYPQQNSGISTLNRVNSNINSYDSQAHYQSNGTHNLYGSCIQGNQAPSSYETHLNRNHHLNARQIGTQHVIPHGIVKQDACQQKPHNVSLIESALKEDFSAFDSSWAENAGENQNISYLHGSRSFNQPPNGSSTQLRDITNIGMVDDIKKFLFDEDGSIPAVENGAFAYELSIESPYASPFDTDMFLVGFDNY